MHILGGELRGRKLVFRKNQDIRPMSQKVRAAIYNILQERILGADVLDLFCGTGSVGLEALSRGAAHADFVDLDTTLVARNVEALGLAERTSIFRRDVHQAVEVIRQKAKTYGFVFVGAPYAYPETARLLEAIGGGNVVALDGELIYEHSNRTEPADAIGSLQKRKTYVYGQTVLTAYVRRV